MSWFQDTWDNIRGKTAANKAASRAQAGADANIALQEDALQYMKDASSGLIGLRDASLGQMGGLLGLGGYDQQQAMQQLQTNPLYQAGLSNIDQQQQNAIGTMGAQAAATGGLRGGNYQRALMESSFDADRAKQNLLGNVYGQQVGALGNIAGMNTGQGAIAGQMSNIGNITGQGIIGAEQTRQAGRQAGMSNLLGFGGLGLGVAGLF